MEVENGYLENGHMYARCKVEPGFFKHELYVKVHGSAAFVHRDNVEPYTTPEEGKEVDGEVSAYLVEDADDQVLIELPGEAAVGGLRTWVSKDTLSFT